MFPFQGDHYFADLEAASQLGLQTEVDLVSGLAATYDWFRENRETISIVYHYRAGEGAPRLAQGQFDVGIVSFLLFPLAEGTICR